jgi:quercetin dioxygenase-like cupin family protein
MFHMTYVIEGQGALVNPDEKHQYRNKGDQPFKMICGVPKEFERLSIGI